MTDDARIPVRRALLSVWDKTGLVELGRALVAHGAELLATGGTARALADAGLAYTEVGTLTGAGEMLGGRVKTLHPAVHAGLLARPDQADELAALGFAPIDLVAVNLYPFAAARDAGKQGVELLEMIDIGGPTMLRAAAKNHARVAVVCQPADYAALTQALTEGGTTALTRAALAGRAFAHTAAYDMAIAAELDTDGEHFWLHGRRQQTLRYGENPHQHATLFRPEPPPAGLSTVGLDVRSGKPLSYNNMLDVDAALRLGCALPVPACAVLKHTNPCGAAVADTLVEAFAGALAGDPLSAFGGIVVATAPIDVATATAITEPDRFFEIVIAPDFAPEALELLTTRPRWGASVRLLAAGGPLRGLAEAPDLRGLAGGGLLVQQRDPGGELAADARSATGHPISDAMRVDLDLAWRLVARVASNAIVLVKDGRLVGMGAGQPSRVDSVELAVKKAGPLARGAVMASDAFFPFADGVERAAEAGVVAVVQPGGSRRDAEVTAAAEAAGMAMILTGRRHFRH